MSPTELNTVFRLALVAKCCGPAFLDDPERMSEVLGRHSLAGLNGQVLQETRRLVKSIGDHRAQRGIATEKSGAERNQQRLQG